MNLKKWQIIVIIICLALGILLHFTYEWSGENKIVGIFSAVNESTWEHLKLVFYPMLIMAIIGQFVVSKNNYWAAQAIGIFTAMLFITVFFYTYRGITGMNLTALNIGSFIVSILLGEYIVYKVMKSKNKVDAEKISIILLILLTFTFTIYTFNPPEIPLFKDPISGNYGI